MTKILKLILFIPLISFGQEKNETKSEYPNYVGDIEFNSEIDTKEFELCNSKHIFQYFNNSGGLEYEGEKLAIEKEFTEKYKSENLTTIDGVKIDFPMEWVHLRKSNTEPIIRIYTEGPTQAEADNLAERFVKELKEIAGI